MSEGDKKSDWFLWLIGVSCLAAIFVSFYFFYFKKDYDFIVEVACDPLKEICFQRDCSNPDDCPPNELSDFKRYSLNAGDFNKCANEDCTEACESGAIKCEPVPCEENLDAGESCSSLQVPVTPSL
jgi:hypothetical protein